MCNGGIHRPMNGLVDPFSTFHFLRTYNRLVTPTELAHFYNISVNKDTTKALGFAAKPVNILLSNNGPVHNPNLYSSDVDRTNHRSFLNSSPNRTTVSSTCPSTPPLSVVSGGIPEHCFDQTNPILRESSLGGSIESFVPGSLLSRRQRGEKRPIPDDQKDDKYFERRKRNNEAAKKSRDARKIREDRVAFRAAILEQENSILRAQVVALREEVNTLRQMLCNRTNALPP